MSSVREIVESAVSGEIARIRSGFEAALQSVPMCDLDAAQAAHAETLADLEAARINARAMAVEHNRQANQGGCNAFAVLLANADAEEARAAVAEIKARHKVERTAEASVRGIGAQLKATLSAQHQVAIDLLASLEAALDPLADLHASLSANGLHAPYQVAVVALALEHLRQMRRVLDSAQMAQVIQTHFDAAGVQA
jgi:hypothetical protein